MNNVDIIYILSVKVTPTPPPLYVYEKYRYGRGEYPSASHAYGESPKLIRLIATPSRVN